MLEMPTIWWEPGWEDANDPEYVDEREPWMEDEELPFE